MAIISPPTRSSGIASPGRSYAKGNVVVLTPEGDKLVGDTVQLTDTLRDGTVDNLMVVLESGGRIAASHGTRVERRLDLHQRHLLALPGDHRQRLPQDVRAGRSPRPGSSTIREPSAVRFEGGRLQLFGINLPLLPIFNISRRQPSGASGFLVPDIVVSSRNGFELGVPLPLAARAQPRPDDHSARLHRRPSRHRTQVSRAEQPRRVPGRRISHLRRASTIRA